MLAEKTKRRILSIVGVLIFVFLTVCEENEGRLTSFTFHIKILAFVCLIICSVSKAQPVVQLGKLALSPRQVLCTPDTAGMVQTNGTLFLLNMC